MKITYVDKKFSAATMKIIETANTIIAEYQAAGFDLTLRQLYYQFVARDLIANQQKEYSRLGSIINDARLAGMIDWNAIVDRTRHVRQNSHWESPAEIVDAAAKQYQVDKWKGQHYRPEVWIEKDALVGVIDGVCRTMDVPFFSCRGYTSQSEMHVAALRLIRYIKAGATPVIIHLGDHDPSGIDMTRDIQDRIKLFIGEEMAGCVRRIALNRDQIDEYDPPANPAKTTDSRSTGYISKYGANSWELDALDPKVLANLIESQILQLRDPEQWEEMVRLEQKHRKQLAKAAKLLKPKRRKS